MIHTVLDTETCSALIEYLRTRNAYLTEEDGTICCNPKCSTREHYVLFEKSNVFSYHDANAGLNAYYPATELWTHGRKIDHSSYAYAESDMLLFSNGWQIKGSTRYMSGYITFRPRHMDGTRKAEWLQEEYKLLMRFIKKRTIRYHDGVFYNYLSPSIEETRRQGILNITSYF